MLRASSSACAALPASRSIKTPALPRCAASKRDVVVSVKPDAMVTPTAEKESVAFPLRSAALASAAFAAPMLMIVNEAMAKEGEFGILEGTTAALVHPVVMGSLFLTSIFAAYSGLNWRSVRTVGEEIRELKKSLPAPAEGEAPTSSPQIKALEDKRKELVAGNFKDKHSLAGAILLASGTGIAIEGCANTFMRTGKLFPGPHLFAGAGIVALWALAGAMVPAMQKGDNNARTAHIVFNFSSVLLFVWQIPTGLEIVDKVFQFTHWP